MSKISELPAIDPATITGAETVPAVKDGQTGRATISELVKPFSDAAAASVAGLDAAHRSILVNRRIRRAMVRRQGGKKGVIYVTIGQSLADRREYSTGAPEIDWTSPHAYMVNGGADRNDMPVVSGNVTNFNAAGTQFGSLAPFATGVNEGGKIDGFAMMADCPTVLGQYQIGARDYETLRKGGCGLFIDMSCFLSQAVYLLETDHGCEDIDVVFSFAHGEAETDGTPTPPAKYRHQMIEWFKDCTDTVRAALDDPAYQPMFLLHQMCGPFNDAWRDLIEVQADFADEYSNVHLTGPSAPYGTEVDRVHLTGEAQVLQGEGDWHAYTRAKAGLPTCLKAHEFRRIDATTLYVPTTYMDGALEIGIDAVNMTDASGFDGSGAKCIYGVRVLADGAEVDLVSVTPSGCGFEIVLAADPGAATLLVEPGLMTAPPQLAAVPLTTPRCNIRSAGLAVPSRYIPTFTHRPWLIHDRIQEAA